MDRDFEATVNPFSLFTKWLGEAETAEPNDPNATALATVDANGLPDVRMVLLKSFDERGFVFFTNAGSTKGRELSANPKAALCLYWKSLGRQIRIRGDVTPATPEEADKYFATRARQSRIGAWASRQSHRLESRAALEEAAAKYAAKFGEGDIPRPDYWRGFRVVPIEIEFWENGEHRLHDRIRFTRRGDGWERTRLYP